MKNKSVRSKEDVRAAIEKEIAAITTDIERLRSLATHESEPHLAHAPEGAERGPASPVPHRRSNSLN